MKTLYYYITICLLALVIKKAEAQIETNFEIHLDLPSAMDTVCLDIHSEFAISGTYILQVDKALVKTSSDGIFKFKLPAKVEPFYISIHSPNTSDRLPETWEQHWLFQYLVVPGDDILIKFDEKTKTITFSGKGSEKYRWRYTSDNHILQLQNKFLTGQKNAKEIISARELILSKTLELLDSVQYLLSPEEYKLLHANTIGSLLGQKVLSLAFLKFHWIPAVPYYSDRSEAEEYVRDYEQIYLKHFDDTSSYLINSSSWPSFMYHRAWAQRSYDEFKGNPIRGKSIEYLKQYPPGPIRDKAILLTLSNAVNAGNLTDSLLENTLSFITTEKYNQIARQNFKNLLKGNEVDNSTIFTDNFGKPTKISDYKGRILIIDMWFTGCLPCIKVAEQMPWIEEQLKDYNDFAFISLSIDKDKETWLQSINPLKKPESNKAYTHYITSATKYLYTSGTGEQNTFIKKYNVGGGYPRILLVDKEGKIVTSTIMAPTDRQLAQGFVEMLKNLLSKRT